MNGTHGTLSPTRGTTDTLTKPAKLGPIFVSVIDAATSLGISRREVYRLLDAGEIESVERGRRRLIVVESLHAFAQRLRDEAAQRRGNAA